MSNTPLKLNASELNLQAAHLTAGLQVLFSGTIYTARDMAHKKLVEMLEAGEKLPFDLNGATIFYAGPAPTPPGKASGSIGPTTAGRMDAYTPTLLAHGLKAMIGKGERSVAVTEAIQKYQAVYFVATGGAAALLAQRVIKSELIAFPELGAEGIYRLELADFPILVAQDAKGGNLFQPNLIPNNSV